MLVKKKIHKYCIDPCGKTSIVTCGKAVNSFASVYQIPIQNNETEIFPSGIDIPLSQINNVNTRWLNFNQLVEGCSIKVTDQDPSSDLSAGMKILSDGKYKLTFNGTIVRNERNEYLFVRVVFMKQTTDDQYVIKQNNVANYLPSSEDVTYFNVSFSVEMNCQQNDIIYVGIYYVTLTSDVSARLLSSLSIELPFNCFQQPNGFDPSSGLNNNMVLQPIFCIEKIMNSIENALLCENQIDTQILSYELDTSISIINYYNNSYLIPFNVLYLPFNGDYMSYITNQSLVNSNDNQPYSSFIVNENGYYNIEFYASAANNAINSFYDAVKVIMLINDENIITSSRFNYGSINTNVVFKTLIYLEQNDHFEIGISMYKVNPTPYPGYIVNSLISELPFVPPAPYIIFNGSIMENAQLNSTLFIIKENVMPSNCDGLVPVNENPEYMSFIINSSLSEQIIIPNYLLSAINIMPLFIDFEEKCYYSARSIANVSIHEDGYYFIKFYTNFNLENIRISQYIYVGIVVNKSSIISLSSLLIHYTVRNEPDCFEIIKFQQLQQNDIVEVFVFSMSETASTSYLLNGNTGISYIPPDETSENAIQGESYPLLNVYKIRETCTRNEVTEQICEETVTDCSYYDQRYKDVYFNDECTVDLFLKDIYGNKSKLNKLVKRKF